MFWTRRPFGPLEVTVARPVCALPAPRVTQGARASPAVPHVAAGDARVS